jgi:osmotically inducible protein OsmC
LERGLDSFKTDNRKEKRNDRNTLSGKGYQPERIETQATCTLSPQKEGGFKITRMHLQVHAQVPDIDQATLKQIAHEADGGCPVSNLLRCGLEIELDVTLARS